MGDDRADVARFDQTRELSIVGSIELLALLFQGFTRIQEEGIHHVVDVRERVTESILKVKGLEWDVELVSFFIDSLSDGSFLNESLALGDSTSLLFVDRLNSC